LEFIYGQSREILKVFGYEHLFIGELENPNARSYFHSVNEKNLKKSIELAEADTVISLTLNDPSKCVRIKSTWRNYPRPLGNFCSSIVGKEKAIPRMEEENKFLDLLDSIKTPMRDENGELVFYERAEVLELYDKKQAEKLKTIPPIKL